MYTATKCSCAALCALFIFLLTLPTLLYAQQTVFRSSDDGAMTMLGIPGGVLIVEGENEARISRRIAPPDSDTETPDLQEGDLIIFLNGSRIKSTDKLRTLYDEIKVDDEVKLGIQRGEEKLISTYLKPEPQSSFSSDDGVQAMRFEWGSDDTMLEMANSNLWPAGFVVGEKDGHVVIGPSMPIPNKAEALSDLAAEDIITSLNGSEIRSVEQLLSEYEQIAAGGDVTVEFSRAGKTDKVMFKKPDPPQMRMRIQQNG